MKTRLLSMLAAFSCAAGLGCGAQNHPAGTMSYTGLCDASAVVSLDGDYFVVADDEDNVIRAYTRQQAGKPVFALDLSAFLQVEKKSPEVDLEGAARLGDRIYWISSHGRNVKGKAQESRQRFFATSGNVSNGVVDLKPIGQPYRQLLRDLIFDPRLRRFNLASASVRPPKAPGALNIEGLCETPDGHLLIGFRNPIPQGNALLVPLLNPAELIEGKQARLGDPVLINLNGLGIRSMAYWRNRYLIIAGSHDSEGTSRLYEWHGGTDEPRWIKSVPFLGLNPEALTFHAGQSDERLLVVSDDGTVNIGGQDCKTLKDPDQKRFRAIHVILPEDKL